MTQTMPSRFLIAIACLLLSTSVLGNTAQAQSHGVAHPTLEAAPNNIRPVAVTFATVMTFAAAGMALGGGLYGLLLGPECGQRSATGECLMTITPNESLRIEAGVMLGVGVVLTGVGILCSVLADEMWRALVPRASPSATRPWLTVDQTSAQAGLVMSW